MNIIDFSCFTYCYKILLNFNNFFKKENFKINGDFFLGIHPNPKIEQKISYCIGKFLRLITS